MALQEGVSWAFRGEWKPFPSVHPSGRPKSAGALLGKPLINKVALSRATDSKFDAKISGKHILSPTEPDFETSSSTIGPNWRHPHGLISFDASDDLSIAPHDDFRSPVVSPSRSAEITPANSSRASKSSVPAKQQLFSNSSSNTKSNSIAITDGKAQKYTLQNMSALIHQSVQGGCAFVPKTSSKSKTASHKQSSFATEATNHSLDLAYPNDSGGDRTAVSASGKRKLAHHESVMMKPSESLSDLVTSICEIREDQRTHYQISVLMKQIASIAFFAKLDVAAQWELCKVMKVQSYYRKDRVFVQGDVGEHFYIILDGKCVVYKELSMAQANDMQLDLSGNDPTVTVTTVANKDWNIGVFTALRAKGASVKILEKVKSREKNAIVKKIVETKEKLERLGDSEDSSVRKYTESLRQELEELTGHLENILIKIGKFSGEVLQTQIEQTIEDAVRAANTKNLQISKAENEAFVAHMSAQNTTPSDSQVGSQDGENAEIVMNPAAQAAESVLVNQPFVPAAESDLATPVYNSTEFLAGDTKIVIKKLVELSVGAAFGEIALENANSKRTATIVAETDCKLITITRADYRRVLADFFAKKKASDIAFLKEVPIFSKLHPRTLETLQAVMLVQNYVVEQVILEAEAETSDFYVVVSGIVRVVMKFDFEGTVTKSNHASSTQKPRTPKELTICKLGPQNIIGDFCVGRKSKSPVAYIADSPQVVILRLALLDCQHYLSTDSSVHSQLMNFARRKSEFYLAQGKAMLKTKGGSYQLACANSHTASSSMIPYPSEAELLAILGENPKPPKIKTDLPAWTRLFPTKTQNPNMPSYWRHDAWRELFERKQHDSAAALNKIDEFLGVTVVGTNVLFPAQESKYVDSRAAPVKQRPTTAVLRTPVKRRGEVPAVRRAEYSVKNRTLNLQSWDMPEEHNVNLSNRVDSSELFGKTKFYYAFDPDEPDADYLEELDLGKNDGLK